MPAAGWARRLAAALLLIAPFAAQAQTARQPVAEERIDELGVEWTYRETADEIDGRWEVLVVARMFMPGPSSGAFLGLQCTEGAGYLLSVHAPGWSFADAPRPTLLMRIDLAEPMEVPFIRDPEARGLAHLDSADGRARRLLDLLAAARQRVVMRSRTGVTVTIPLGAPRTELDQAFRRCGEINPGR
jgi:hypothetical protein